MQVLHLFIKTPRLGYVKTRLAATVGNEAALDIYRFLLQKTREAALETHATRWLWYSEAINPDDEWDGSFDKKVQPDGDLGHRMSTAFRTSFEAGAQKAVIIGSDCPEVTGQLIDTAFELLTGHDVVIGPTFDGGYYLLGMRSFQPSLFENIAWSTPAVFDATMERCTAAGLSTALLPRLNDIDEAEDWERYREYRISNKE